MLFTVGLCVSGQCLHLLHCDVCESILTTEISRAYCNFIKDATWKGQVWSFLYMPFITVTRNFSSCGEINEGFCSFYSTQHDIAYKMNLTFMRRWSNISCMHLKNVLLQGIYHTQRVNLIPHPGSCFLWCYRAFVRLK